MLLLSLPADMACGGMTDGVEDSRSRHLRQRGSDSLTNANFLRDSLGIKSRKIDARAHEHTRHSRRAI